jgi:putative endonuclease
MKVYTYLLRSFKDESYYVGISSDPYKRLEYHNNGYLKTTSRKKPYALVYLKKHLNYQEARKHEKWLKKKNKEYKNKLAQLAPPEMGGVK